MNRLTNLHLSVALLLTVSSTGFTPHSSLPKPHQLRVASGEDIRTDRSKSFSPIQTVHSPSPTNNRQSADRSTFSPIETVRSSPNTDNRYSNNVSSHVSTLYSGGTVVQDFQEGSAARHTAPGRYETTVGSYGAVAATASKGHALQDFRGGSASTHTVAESYNPPTGSGAPFAPAAPATTYAYESNLDVNDPAYPGNKHFQLEELEDAESCTTDIFLNSDNTLTVGETNGPRFLSGGGTWATSQGNDNGNTSFEMILGRKYMTGKEGKQDTDIGEFEYDVERTFRGELTLVGGTALAVNGEILDVDETFGDRRVGFFSMIDTTDARKADNVDP